MAGKKILAPDGFSERLQDLILSSGKEITTISKESGIARTTVYDLAYHYRDPKATTIIVLCNYFKVTPNYLLFGRE